MGSYAKIIRFDDYGFNCKPYYINNFHTANRQTRGYTNSFNLINSKIDSLHTYKQKVNESSIIKYDSKPLVGCFCFLDEFDNDRFRESLKFRLNDKKNIAYIPTQELIWVRNTSHKGIQFPYFDTVLSEGGKVSTEFVPSIFNHLMWVKMPVYLALERTKLWKESHDGNLPEWLTEFYLMEQQLETLKKFPFFSLNSLISRLSGTISP
ncbi:hypothetical protein [Mangrovibacillus cuniculi]|uniref:Uncharacterized protein n=1 Tax=Mangrovibacillus cuniculi TaxID=2593652 RepID=A0A7S8HGL4_9BACI|nr:hypothetical protein [Mangrovibacillus cuniculi]QPC47555.1 hypothetical protein G8O30_11635 [Mangrovibacillus cuniculi]